MHRWLKRTLDVLDGVPAASLAPSAARPGQRAGQSLVEMVFITPLLLIMFAGLIEIGWLAGNFLVLLDVTREAGRFGAQLDPTLWTYGDELNIERMDCDVNRPLQEYPNRDAVNLLGDVFLPPDDVVTRLVGPANYNYVDSADLDIGYFDGVACTLLRNMDPLRFDAARDDIAISVFSYVVQNSRETDTNPPQVVVTGRYPPRTNECNNETYDPFDWNHNNNADEWASPATVGEDIYGYDAAAENMRGFVMTGRHIVSGYEGSTQPCRGSEFSTAEVQAMLNEMAPLEMRNFPNNGMVLVELFWHHDQLLNLPFFTVFGNGFELHVWSVFAATAAEPTQTPSS